MINWTVLNRNTDIMEEEISVKVRCYITKLDYGVKCMVTIDGYGDDETHIFRTEEMVKRHAEKVLENLKRRYKVSGMIGQTSKPTFGLRVLINGK